MGELCVKVLDQVADLFWDGITLKHVEHRGIVIPYFLFICFVFIFELFLVVLMGVSIHVFITLQYVPGFEYYLALFVLLLMLLLTCMVLYTLVKRWRRE